MTDLNFGYFIQTRKVALNDNYSMTCILLFCFPVHSAKLTAVGGLFSSKPDPYLELVVDGQPPRKTEVVRKNSAPKWDEQFTVWVFSCLTVKEVKQVNGSK